MSYIGNAPISAAFLTDTFSGNGSTVAFTMTVAPANTSSILVSVTGVLQSPDTYSVSGTTLTFSAAPPSGTSNISVRYLGIPASGVTTTAYRTVTEFTATSGQTSFSVPSYTVGYIDVYRNGVMLGTADFTATTGTTVVLATGATTGDLIRTESFYVSSVLNAIPNSPASVGSSNIVSGVTLTAPNLGTPASGVMTNVTSIPAAQLTGSQAIPKATLPTGSVLQVVQATTTNYASTTSGTFTDTNLSATITPSSSSSKILVLVTQSIYVDNGGADNGGSTQIVRNSTGVFGSGNSNSFYINAAAVSATALVMYVGMNYLDSPATTSATTYKTQMRAENSSTIIAQVNNNTSSITLLEIAA